MCHPGAEGDGVRVNWDGAGETLKCGLGTQKLGPDLAWNPQTPEPRGPEAPSDKHRGGDTEGVSHI